MTEMTELEALKIVWEHAAPEVPGANPKLAEAHLKVGELIERVAGAEGNEIGTLTMAEDVMFDIGWVPIEYIEASRVRELLREQGIDKLAEDLSNHEISRALDEATTLVPLEKVLSDPRREIVREAARNLCERHGQAWWEYF